MKQGKRTLEILRDNEHLLVNTPPTVESERIKEVAINLLNLIRGLVHEEMRCQLSGKPMNREARERRLLEVGIPKWVYNKFSSKLENVTGMRFNFSRLFFVKNAHRSLALTRAEWNSAAVRSALDVILENSKCTIKLMSCEKTLMRLAGFVGESFADLEDIELKKITLEKFYATPCDARIKDRGEEYPTTLQPDYYDVAYGASGILNIHAVVNTWASLGALIIKTLDGEKARDLVFTDKALSLIENVAESEIFPVIRKAVKDWSYENIWNVETTLRNLNAGLDYALLIFGNKTRPGPAALIELLQERVPARELSGDKEKSASKKSATTEVVAAATTAKSSETKKEEDNKAPVKRTVVVKSVLPTTKLEESVMKKITAIVEVPVRKTDITAASGAIKAPVHPEAKAYMGEIARVPSIGFLVNAMDDYLRGFQSSRIQIACARMLAGSLEAVITRGAPDPYEGTGISTTSNEYEVNEDDAFT
jgi:hypothetical protein